MTIESLLDQINRAHLEAAQAIAFTQIGSPAERRLERIKAILEEHLSGGGDSNERI